jgi:CBS domain-containing protein
MKVKEIMTRTPAVCSADTPLTDVARTMVGSDCGAVPVVQGTGAGGLVGIITDRDMVVRAIAEGKNPLTLKARDCMTSPAISVRDDASMDECTRLMESKKIRRVPVVDASGSVVGIVAQADVARHASREDAGELVRDVSTPSR